MDVYNNKKQFKSQKQIQFKINQKKKKLKKKKMTPSQLHNDVLTF